MSLPVDAAASRARALEENIGRVIRGKTEQIRRAVVTLLARGHLLIEDVPGVGKTMLARAIARSLDATQRRVQFTPDLLPSDITGVSVFNQRDQVFEFRPGPIFTQVLLADEINRATPRTQAALLEAMGERQVTADGQTRKLPALFFVMATQNPIEQQGTFPLPEAELDRFLLRISIGYPEAEVEADLLEQHRLRHPIDDLKPCSTAAEVGELQDAVLQIHVAASIRRYIVGIAQRTRTHREVLLGASPRATLGLMRASQALALLRGRSHVEPEDVKQLCPEVFGHRLIVRPQARVAGLKAAEVIADCLDLVEAPVRLE